MARTLLLKARGPCSVSWGGADFIFGGSKITADGD